MLKIVKIVIVAVLATIAVDAAPRTSGTYDQKQHGDYNIRLHLKDFQIIALMDDGFGDLGDYDYTYDYSDLTVKPVLSLFTTPSAPTSASSSTASPSEKHTTTQSASTEQPNQELKVNNTINTTSESVLSTADPVEVSTTNSVSDDRTNQTITISDVIPLLFVKTGIPAANTTNIVTGANKTAESTTVASETVTEQHVVITPENNIVKNKPLFLSQLPVGPQSRRCATGFRKDKRGRCRRLRRRGGVPLEVQLANFAQRLRQSGTLNAANAVSSGSNAAI